LPPRGGRLAVAVPSLVPNLQCIYRRHGAKVYIQSFREGGGHTGYIGTHAKHIHSFIHSSRLILVLTLMHSLVPAGGQVGNQKNIMTGSRKGNNIYTCKIGLPRELWLGA
jgi:hypothetical protein